MPGRHAVVKVWVMPHAAAQERWMALAFAVGSACFLVGPFPGYVQLVGARADAVTFFVGSIFFTAGGALQSRLAFAQRRERGAGRAAWWSAIVQSAGTLFFNRSTFQALDTAFSNPSYNRLVWRPDALGSICFLVSGVIAYLASDRRGWLPVRGAGGWGQPAPDLLGCIFFCLFSVARPLLPSSAAPPPP